jgi:hypothetical protein
MGGTKMEIMKKRLLKLGKDSEINGRMRKASLALVIPSWWLQNAGFVNDRDEIGLELHRDRIVLRVYINKNINTILSN